VVATISPPATIHAQNAVGVRECRDHWQPESGVGANPMHKY
jgi:hypothetical protein